MRPSVAAWSRSTSSRRESTPATGEVVEVEPRTAPLRETRRRLRVSARRGAAGARLRIGILVVVELGFAVGAPEGVARFGVGGLALRTALLALGLAGGEAGRLAHGLRSGIGGAGLALAAFDDHGIDPLAERLPGAARQILGDLPRLGIDPLDAPWRVGAHRITLPGATPKANRRFLGCEAGITTRY
jgi:hypothetical protein